MPMKFIRKNRPNYSLLVSSHMMVNSGSVYVYGLWIYERGWTPQCLPAVHGASSTRPPIWSFWDYDVFGLIFRNASTTGEGIFVHFIYFYTPSALKSAWYIVGAHWVFTEWMTGEPLLFQASSCDNSETPSSAIPTWDFCTPGGSASSVQCDHEWQEHLREEVSFHKELEQRGVDQLAEVWPLDIL